MTPLPTFSLVNKYSGHSFVGIVVIGHSLVALPNFYLYVHIQFLVSYWDARLFLLPGSCWPCRAPFRIVAGAIKGVFLWNLVFCERPLVGPCHPALR